MKSLTFFAADADRWEADGMPREEIDALVLALWRWYRGRPRTEGLSVAAKVLYSTITKRLEATDGEYVRRAKAGMRGGKKTQAHNRSARAKASAENAPFAEPTEDEVRAYCEEKGYANVSAEDFVDYYASNGWVVGSAPMKDWRRTVDRWHRKNLREKAADGVSEETSYVQPGYVLRLGAPDAEDAPRTETEE